MKQTILLFLPLLFYCCNGNEKQNTVLQNDSTLYFSPKVSKLIGIIRDSICYGPPNFGDSPDVDSKDTIYYIELMKSIRIFPDPDYSYSTNDNVDTINSILNIQILQPPNHQLKKYLGKSISANATIEHALSGNHRTEAIVILKDINLNTE